MPLKTLLKCLDRFMKNQSGATAIEYALIVGLIFLAVVTAIGMYTQNTNTLYQHISDAVTGAG